MGRFVFNEGNSERYGLVVEHFPSQPKPARKLRAVSRIADNGVLLLADNGFEPVTLTYDCYFKGSPLEASKIADWLLSAPGFCKLSDSYNRGGWRQAICLGPLDISNHLNRYGRVSISFLCQPELYIDSGATPIDIVPNYQAGLHSGYAINPTSFVAKPKIKISGRETTSIRFANLRHGLDSTFSIDFGPNKYIEIDCETGLCMGSNGYPAGHRLTFSGGSLPFLPPGETLVSIPNGINIDYIEITPRWWTL